MLKNISFIAAILIISYIIVAFVLFNFNPAKWPAEARVAMVLFTGLMWIDIHKPFKNK